MVRKILATLAVVMVTVVACVSFGPKQEVQALPARNLKYYDKNMKQAALYKEMRRISKELGVKCAFCHVMTPRKQFEKDTKHKAIALKMLRLTDTINKDISKIFKGKEHVKVTCYTCHRGEKHPLAEPEDD